MSPQGKADGPLCEHSSSFWRAEARWVTDPIARLGFRALPHANQDSAA